MVSKTRVLFLLPLYFLIGSCGHPLWTKSYSGEGEFVDNGWEAAHDRYILRLGQVDFSTIGTTEFQILKLPNVPFMIGIAGLPTAFRDSGPTVRMNLIDTTKKASVFEFEGELSRSNGWKFSTFGRGEGFLYLGPEVPTVGSRDLGHVWGTRFTPRLGHSYEMEVEIQNPSMEGEVGEIVLKGGGWK